MSEHDPEEQLRVYLKPTPFIESAAPAVRAFAASATRGASGEIAQAVALFFAVRDEIRYDPYGIALTLEGLRATAVLERRTGFCVSKAVLLAAAARARGIPARLGFADVRNHLATERLKALMGTDLFVFHGFTELHLGGRWVKATPTFNRSLCERFRVLPLDFDGVHDAVLHPFDADGKQHMEYVNDRGRFADVPLADLRATFAAHYPALAAGAPSALGGDFEAEAAAEHARR